MAAMSNQVRPWLANRRALTAGLLLLAVSIVLGVLASIYDTFPGDDTVSSWARALGDGYDPVAHLFNRYDWLGGLVISVTAIGLLWWRGHLDAAGVALVVVCMRPVLQGFKLLVGRPRPEGDFAPLVPATDPSFPSGHTMTAAVAAGILIAFAPQLVGARYAIAVRVGGVAIIVLMATSRMWAGAHWFSDTYGAVIWVLTTFVLAYAFRSGFGRALSGISRTLRLDR
jgi:membrane-associated phospholipid phosphatase